MSDLDAAVEVMVQAFFDDPLWTYLIPGEHRRKRLLPGFFRAFLRRGIEREEVYGVEEPPQGVAVWVIAHQGDDWTSRPSELAYLELLLDPQFTSPSRAISLFSMLDELQMRHAPGPHLYLSTIGVAAEARGRGLASRLIKPFLALADERSLPIYTETLELPNIGFYGHFDFSIMQMVEVPRGPLRIWSLLRCPRSNVRHYPA